MGKSSQARQVIRFGVFEVDLRAGELRKQGLRIKLQDQPLQILALLLQNPGEVVLREELRERLWPADTFVDFEHGLNRAINKLREALGDSAENPRFVETVPRRGYRFIGAINETCEATAETVSPGGTRRQGLWIAAVAVAGVLAVLGLNFRGLRERLFGRPGPGPIQSIAVLPLENLSGDTSQEYFVDGITDALTTNLAQIRALRVISRTSAMRYKGAKKSLPEIAQELNVDAVVEGAVARWGDRVRVTAQLVHARSDRHVWAQTYERDLRDILALQSEVARAIANEVRIKLTPEEHTRLTHVRPVHPEAYLAYLKGRHLWNKRTDEDVKKAIEYFEQAIALDPNYARAYAGAADAYASLGFAAYGVVPTTEAERKGEAAARKALEMDDTLAEAHTALGTIQFVKWNWREAEREFQQAIELDPNYAPAYQFYALLLSSLRRQEEALTAIRRARELEPLSLMMNAALGRHLYLARQYDQAIEQLQKALELDPHFWVTCVRLGQAYEQKGMYEEAIAELSKARTLSGDNLLPIVGLGHAYAMSGQKAKAQKVIGELKELSKRRYVASYFIAAVYTGMGEREQAFAWLEKAYQQREGSLVHITVEPMLDPLRSDPRFAQLVRRLGLP